MQVLFIFLSIFEIILTAFFVMKLISCEKKVNDFHEKFLILAKEVVVINDKIHSTISKINKVVAFLANKNIYRAITIIKSIINTIQIILLIRSFDFSKGKKVINYKNIKKLLLTEGARQVIRNIIRFYLKETSYSNC